MRHATRSLTLLAAVAVLCACDPSPEEACEGYIAYRKAKSFPADDEIRSKCVAALEWVRDEAKGDAYGCASNGLKNASGKEVSHVETTIQGCSSQYGENIDEMTAYEKWGKGIAGDYDAEAQTVKAPGKDGFEGDGSEGWVRMFPQECDDMALHALKKKIDEGVITDAAEGEAYADGLRADCLEVMETKESGKFRCVQLSTDSTAIDECLAG